MRASSLQARLLALVLGAVALVWLAAVATTWLDVRHELNELLDSHLAQAAALLVAQQSHDDDDEHGIDAPSLHHYAPKVAFQVFHEGRLVLRSANAPAQPLVAADEKFTSGLRSVRVDGAAWRVFAAHGAERDVLVYVGEQAASRTSILWAVLRGTAWPMLLALPVLALVVWIALRHGTAPLRALGRALTQRPAHALQPLALTDTPREVQVLMDALNGLLTRIAMLLDAERRFTADAAHELRTPIAAIRAQAQVALEETDDALRRHALQATLWGCDRATRLVEQLLTLTRLDAESAPALGRVDLAGLARGVVAALAPQAVAKRQTLQLDAPEPCSVAGDETLIAVLLRNLVDNAIRYSPANARVHVGLRRDGATASLRVEDSGPGLPDRDLQRLGERFFRAGSQEHGSGLGWSIVQRIAAVHTFGVEVRRSSLGGLEVQVRAPLASN
jgi:two-component system sensor histidine kinase QseC